MFYRGSTRLFALAAALIVTMGGASADDAKYPSWKGQWRPFNAPGIAGQKANFDPSKPEGPGQEAPLTPEYQQIYKKSLEDQAIGGPGNDPTQQCYAGGMPRMMNFEAQEYIVTPDTTYILLGGDDNLRRISTDGRDWPAKLNPTYQGYSIGRWIDEDHDGTYDVLEAETRGPFKGPRAYDSTGLPLHYDNESTFKERFFVDKADANVLHDVMTIFDHALTRPWTVDKTYRRNTSARPDWPEYYCAVTTRRMLLGKENYGLSDDGLLMPSRKDQPPPDLRYFKQTSK